MLIGFLPFVPETNQAFVACIMYFKFVIAFRDFLERIDR